jgi:phasin family protein
MSAKQDDLGAYLELTRRAFAPAARLNELAARNIERLARFQYEIAGDWMQFGLEQMQAAVGAKDVGTLLARQAEIANQFAEKAARRQQDLAKISTDTQAGFASWVEEASAGVTKAA